VFSHHTLLDQDRLRTQEALRQSQKMESLGQLTGGVAHDFNNLLAVFANGLQVLERNASAEQRQRVYASMRRAVARGSGLTHQLLSFSRRRPVNPESIDLPACLQGMRDLLARAQRGDIEIRMELAPDTWPVVIDPGEFELAILNLCVNARDAMDCGGTIRITTDNVTEHGEGGLTGDFVRLSVEDTGCGMPPEVLSRVFEPFFTTKGVGKGTGLGMPQVYGFVQQSGGRLALKSEVGNGTVVTLLLPRSQQRPAGAFDGLETPDLPENMVRQGHVLLVEDDPEVAALTREMLLELGFTVVHAGGPAAALGALANGRPIDFVISDIVLPGGMNGLELAREIRRRHPALKVVLTTGYSEATGSMDGEEFALLMKPYSVEGLCEALSARLEGSG
jgi:CheY-like chemotaxis protein